MYVAPGEEGRADLAENSTFSEYLQRGENKVKKDKFMAQDDTD